MQLILLVIRCSLHFSSLSP